MSNLPFPILAVARPRSHEQMIVIPPHLREPWWIDASAAPDERLIAAADSLEVARAIVALPKMYAALADMVRQVNRELTNKKTLSKYTLAAMHVGMAALTAADGEKRL